MTRCLSTRSTQLGVQLPFGGLTAYERATPEVRGSTGHLIPKSFRTLYGVG